MRRPKRKAAQTETVSDRQPRLPLALREQRRTRDPVPEPLVRQLLRPLAAADSKFELVKDHSQRFEPRQPGFPFGGDQVAQQPNQRPAIVLGQVEGALCLQLVTASHRGHPLGRSETS